VSLNFGIPLDIFSSHEPRDFIFLYKMQNRWKIRIKFLVIEMSFEKMKSIIKLGRKSIWIKAKKFPPLEEPNRKYVIKIFVKINDPTMSKFKSL
jgi:hypothetical protein